MRILPERTVRQRALRVLADSIRRAHATGPGRWGLTLKPTFIRLNVGPAEAVLLGSDYLELMVDLESLRHQGKEHLLSEYPPISEGHYASMPSSAYVVRVDDPRFC
jgi:hypothetical protein